MPHPAQFSTNEPVSLHWLWLCPRSKREGAHRDLTTVKSHVGSVNDLPYMFCIPLAAGITQLCAFDETGPRSAIRMKNVAYSLSWQKNALP
jgi:hypothetical protein